MKISRKKKKEFSRLFCLCAALAIAGFGVWVIVRYENLTELAITAGAYMLPDATLPCAFVTGTITPIIAYLIYQAGLKNSRNKYGVDSDGNPYKHAPDGSDAPDGGSNGTTPAGTQNSAGTQNAAQGAENIQLPTST